MLRISTPWDSQPQEAVGPDQRWIDRGLVYADDGRGSFWTPATGVVPATIQAGRPKATAGIYGISQGFGSALGFGTSDTLVTGTIPRTAKARSYISFQYTNGGGAGGGGRIAENSAATATEMLASQSDGFLHYFVATSGAAGQYKVAGGLPLGSWTCVGISHDKTSVPILPVGYVNGAAAAVSTVTSATGSYTTTAYQLTRGNRTSDNGRVWDGILGPIYVFESLLLASEHQELASNPWQLFAPRSIRVPVSSASSGTSFTITPSGGISFGGTSVDVKGKILTVSGGVTFSGTGSATFASGGTTYTITPTGGLVFAGSGVSVNSKVFLPSGGITFGGSGLDLRTKIIDIGGGVSLGGTGNMTSNTSTGPVQSGERTKVGVGT